MAEKKTTAGVGGNISVRGDVTGSALASGQDITATVTFAGSDADERRQVLQALAAIQAELTSLSGATAPIAKSLAATAVESAKLERPNKDEIGNLLDTALKTARQSAEFAGVAVKLAPYVHTAANWLGGQWLSLSALLS